MIKINYIKDDNSHTIIIGAPGSGKTQGVMLPQIKLAIKAGESLFINDVKGEILDEIGGELKNNNYNIIALDYANLEKGNYYNVLTFPYELYKYHQKFLPVKYQFYPFSSFPVLLKM